MKAILWTLMLVPGVFAGAALAIEPARVPMQFLVGTWDCTGRFLSSGKPIASTIRFNFDMGGKVLVKHHDDKPPNGYHAIEDWVAKRDGSGYVAAIVDEYSGVREFDAADWKHGSLTWQSSAGVTPDQRFVYTRLGVDLFRLDWAVSRDGKSWKTGDTLTCKRRRAA